MHDDGVRFWASGETATPGIESMAETGGTSTLRSEIRSHLPTAVLSVISGPGLGTSPARTTISSVVVRGDYPLVTLVTMIAPSPDWFVGVSALSLMDDLGQWVDELQVTLYPYDSGTDDGTSRTSWPGAARASSDFRTCSYARLPPSRPPVLAPTCHANSPHSVQVRTPSWLTPSAGSRSDPTTPATAHFSPGSQSASGTMPPPGMPRASFASAASSAACPPPVARW